MNKYEKLYKLSDTVFKRLIGVKREAYQVMVEEYKKYDEKERTKNHGIGGRNRRCYLSSIVQVAEEI